MGGGRLALAASLLVAQAPRALAEAPEPAAPANASAAETPARAVSGVTVVGQRPAAQTRIDRRIYSVASDLQATSGSAGDVLKNIPSVEVDAQGEVSLRGDPNVQILIDGKPSTLMSSANRAAALEQMSADTIDRIEVITNPSAQFKPDGSAGVINIVTKRGRKSGRTGSLQASVGSEGRYNLGASGTWAAGPLNLYGGVTLRRDVRKREITDARQNADSAGAPQSGSRQSAVNETRRLSPVVSGGADWDVTRTDRLSAALSYNDRTGTPSSVEHDVSLDAAGAPTSDYVRTGSGREREVNANADLKYRHSFGDDHEFTLGFQRGESDEHQRRTYLNSYALPASPRTSDELRIHEDELVRELSAEYTRPLPGAGKLVAGYDVERDDDDYDNYGGDVDLVTGVRTPDPTLTNHFVYGQSVHAIYTTLERPFGKWTVLGGLRLEQVYMDMNQVTSGLKDRNSYGRVYPTLHLQYALSDADTLRASYSHRAVRPEPDDLNPYPIYQDAFDLRAGNPRLMPQETHSLEAGWQRQRDGTSWQATAYYRKSYNGITDVSRYISPSVLLTTKENLGRSTYGGLEFAGSGKLSPKLSYNLSGSVFYNQIDASNLGFTTPRSGVGYTGKGSLDWKPTASDTFQLSAWGTGERLTAQGRRLPTGALNVGYRRRLRDDATLVFTVSDLLNSQRDRTVVDLPTLHDTYGRRQLGRVAWIGVTRRFGGTKKPSDDKFDYSN